MLDDLNRRITALELTKTGNHPGNHPEIPTSVLQAMSRKLHKTSRYNKTIVVLQVIVVVCCTISMWAHCMNCLSR